VGRSIAAPRRTRSHRHAAREPSTSAGEVVRNAYHPLPKIAPRRSTVGLASAPMLGVIGDETRRSM
jgi:hypothetical protein